MRVEASWCLGPAKFLTEPKGQYIHGKRNDQQPSDELRRERPIKSAHACAAFRMGSGRSSLQKSGPDFGEGFSRRLPELSRPRCRANAARRFHRSRSRRRRRGVHQIHWRWCGDNALADRERAPSTRDSTIAVLPLVRGRGSRRAYLGRKGFFYGDYSCAEEISVRSQ
jgi:hypothetical protein